jgi:putative heme iron utilization protein
MASSSQQQQGHSVPNTDSTIAAEPEDPEVKSFQQHQATAPRLSLPDEARTLIADSGLGTLSTISRDPAGFPFGSIVEYVDDGTGCPIFAMSSLSPHTGDILTDGRCSLTVTATGFASLADARFTLTGQITPLLASEVPPAKSKYLEIHPNSYWVEFGDFKWFQMKDISVGRLVGGFGRIGKISAQDYLAATPDPVAKFSGPVAGHMNEDHADSIVAMVKHCAGITVSEAKILRVDSLGMDVSCQREGEVFKCRVPFSQPAGDRKAIKDRIVELTRAAAAAGKA